MRIERRYTASGRSPYAEIAFRYATSEIRNPDGSVVFRLENIEVPESWSQVAADVLAQKYFRKAGVPARLKKVEENDVPSWLWRSAPDDKALAAKGGNLVLMQPQPGVEKVLMTSGINTIIPVVPDMSAAEAVLLK